MEAPRTVGALIGVGAEAVPLGLDEVGPAGAGPEAVQVGRGVCEGGSRDAAQDGGRGTRSRKKGARSRLSSAGSAR